MAKYYSKTAFAKYANRSNGAITQAVKGGRIEVGEHGIDPDHPTNRAYLEKCAEYDQAAGRPARSADDTQRPAAEGAPVKHTRRKKQAVEIPNDKSYNLPPPVKPSRKATKLAAAKQLKIDEEIEEKRLKNAARRKELVDRETVRRVFGKLYKVDVDEFRTIGSRSAPEIANLCSVDDSETILKIAAAVDKEIFAALRHVQKIMNDFFDEVGSERLQNENSRKIAK